MEKYKLQNVFLNCYLVLIIILICLLEGCTINYNYHCIEYSDKNPTKYIFNKNIKEIREKIITNKDYIQQVFCDNYEEARKSTKLFTNYFCESGLVLRVVKDSIQIYNPDKGRVYYLKTNSIDLFLISEGWKSSEICFNDDGIPLEYKSNYQIHFEIIDSLTTQVEIIALHPRLITGKQIMGGRGFANVIITSPTEPTSIEEYKILLKIGEFLGVKEEMPLCKYRNLKR